MKVLHIVAGKLNSGAARGAFWLHKALQQEGVKTTLLTNSINNLDDSSIVELPYYSQHRNSIEKAILSSYPNRVDFIFSTGFLGINFQDLQAYKEADLIHLHWINNNFINMKELKSIDKPIVWTLRDMWPMTGGCHYSFDCDKYTTYCSFCPQLNSKIEKDLSNLIFRYKKNSIPSHTQIVGISNWISQEARKSTLLKKMQIKTISNNVNVDIFKPYDKKSLQSSFGFPQHKTILLAGANNIHDPYKGFDKLVEITNSLCPQKFFLCIFGEADKNHMKNLGLPYRLMGRISSDEQLNKIYSSADIFLAPSIQEAFGKTLVEAMLSGTPVICFDATGPKDIVSHKIDGYKVVPYDSREFKRGIEWILENYDSLRNNAIKNARHKFSSHNIAKEYIKLYNELVKNFNRNFLKNNDGSTEVEKEVEDLKSKYGLDDKQVFLNSFRGFYDYIQQLSNKKSRYVLYGYGSIGKTIHALMPQNIIGHVDINDISHHPTKLLNMDFDKIIITVLGNEKEIIEYLTKEIGIDNKKILVFKL